MPVGCTSCGAQMPNDAAFCPSCGAKAGQAEAVASTPVSGPQQGWIGKEIAKNPLGCFGCLGVIVAAAFGFVVFVNHLTAPPQRDQATIAREAAEKAENRRKGFHCLSLMDGSQPDIVEAVKAKLTDPDSFQHIETRITPANKAGYHDVMMRFRSKNAFNGMVEGQAIGFVDGRNCKGTLVAVR